ncbi:MAG: WXG100 family type VII secretion target [Pseudonocardiaceae bacterium]
MTGAGFDVDPTRLRGAAPQFDVVADQLRNVTSTLTAALSAEGECWGGDEAGQTFAQSYLPQSEAATTALGGVVEVLRAIRTSLDASADTWEGADLTGAGRFGSGRGGQR